MILVALLFSLCASAVVAQSSLADDEREVLFSLHKDLVNIPSVSNEESECADFVSKLLEKLGYYVDKVPSPGSSGYNVFAYPTQLHDQGIWPEVLITSHIDTVPPFYPFELREENGKKIHFGRGTADDKGAVASMIIASHKFFLERSDEPPRLGMLFVVQEELGGIGMTAFAKYAEKTTFRAAIFGEPTEGKLASGQKGGFAMVLNITGKASHSGYPWLGVNAINYLGEAIVALNELEPTLPKSDLLGDTNINVGVVQGGVADNIVPGSANASVSFRVPSTDKDAVSKIRDAVTDKLKPIKERLEAAHGTFDINFSTWEDPALILDTDVDGLEKAPVFFGTDIAYLPQVQKRYLLGPGSITVAHTANEQLTQDDLVQAADAYGLILKTLFPLHAPAL